MLKFYLLLNSFSYLAFTLWCFFKTASTATFLGYSFLNNNGKTEYAAIYIGLELGLAVFFAICGFSQDMKLPGLIFAVCLYAGLMVARTAAAFHYGNSSGSTYAVGSLEYAFGIWGIILLMAELK